MSVLESIVAFGLLILLGIGVVLMIAPFRTKKKEHDWPVLREIEPLVGQDDQLIDDRARQSGYEQRPGVSDQAAPASDEVGPAAEAVDRSDEDIAPDDPRAQADDELLYLVATDEVDSEQRQPALWAKVIALNSGDEQKARFHYIRLRAAQMSRNQPDTAVPVEDSAVVEVTEVVLPVPAVDAPSPVLPDGAQKAKQSVPVINNGEPGLEAESAFFPVTGIDASKDAGSPASSEALSLTEGSVEEEPGHLVVMSQSDRDVPDRIDAEAAAVDEAVSVRDAGLSGGARSAAVAGVAEEEGVKEGRTKETVPEASPQQEDVLLKAGVDDRVAYFASQSGGQHIAGAGINVEPDQEKRAGPQGLVRAVDAPESDAPAPPEVLRSARSGSTGKGRRSAGSRRAARDAVDEGARGFGPILNMDLVTQVIESSRLIGQLIRSADLLRDFSVARYVTSEEIRSSRAGKVESWPEASAYFDDYQHRTAVNLGNSLERFDRGLVRSYLLAKQFPHQIGVDFFDEALIVTVLPGSPQMEFLVLVPGGGLDDPLSAKFLASSRITELFMAAASENQNPLALYIELDLLLERLRIG